MASDEDRCGRAGCTNAWRVKQDSDRYCAQHRLCPTTTPETHGLGEFPMTCYRCHIEADS